MLLSACYFPSSLPPILPLFYFIFARLFSLFLSLFPRRFFPSPSPWAVCEYIYFLTPTHPTPSTLSPSLPIPPHPPIRVFGSLKEQRGPPGGRQSSSSCQRRHTATAAPSPSPPPPSPSSGPHRYYKSPGAPGSPGSPYQSPVSPVCMCVSVCVCVFD